MFGFDLVNASHDEIHISAFNELALSLYDQIQIGIVYIVSNGYIKTKFFTLTYFIILVNAFIGGDV